MGKGIYDGTGLRSLYDGATDEPTDPVEPREAPLTEFEQMVEETSAADLKHAVATGELDGDEVAAAEARGKNRKTVLALATTDED